MTQPNSRERLLEVAEALFAKQGYLSTSVREIVQGAGVQPPALYYHFKNKEALLVELLTTRFDEYCSSLNALLAKAETPEDVFNAFVEHAVAGLTERPNSIRFVFGVLYGPQHKIPVKLVRKLQFQYNELVLSRLRELRPDLSRDRLIFVTTSFLGMTLSMTLHYLVLGNLDFPKDLGVCIAKRCAAMLDDEHPVPHFGA